MNTDAARGPNEEETKSKQTGKLFLKLDRDKLDAAEFILETTPGDIKVYFYFPAEGKNYLAPARLWVSEDYDEDSLIQLLGQGNVVRK